MKLALGILFIWSGAACYYLATHDLGARTPGEAFAALLKVMREQDQPGSALGVAGGGGAIAGAQAQTG